MKNFALKIFIAAMAGILVGALSFYAWKSKYALPVASEKFEKKSGIESNNGFNAKDESAKIFETDKAEIISYVENNINRLSGEKPTLGGKWGVVKVWFIDDKNFYVDYKDAASDLRRILVFQAVGGRGATYEVLGRFIPGESGWTLQSGKDLASAAFLRLYEKSEETGEWIIK